MGSDRTRAVVVLGVLAFGLMGSARAASAVCVLTCPADVRRSVATVDDSVVVDYTVTGNADCEGIIQTQGLPSGSAFPVGTTTNGFQDTESAATCQFDVVVVAVGRPGAPALGALGLSALAALLAGLGIWSARRRSRTAF